jgi:excisionase family DNA binding protein
MTKHLSIKSISTAAEVSPWTVRGWIRKGWIPAVKIGGAVRIAESDFKKFIASPKQQRKGDAE